MLLPFLMEQWRRKKRQQEEFLRKSTMENIPNKLGSPIMRSPTNPIQEDPEWEKKIWDAEQDNYRL